MFEVVLSRGIMVMFEGDLHVLETHKVMLGMEVVVISIQSVPAVADGRKALLRDTSLLVEQVLSSLAYWVVEKAF